MGSSQAELLDALRRLTGRDDYAIARVLRNGVGLSKIYQGEVEMVGDYVHLRTRERPGMLQGGKGPAHGGGVRGKVRGYSSASRRRLFREVNRLPDGLPLPLFTTLTLPGGYGFREADFIGDAASPASMAGAFKVMRKRLERAYPESVGIWRKEWQKRGALHWHLALWGMGVNGGRDLRRVQEWLSRSWYEAVGSGDERHLRAGTQIVTARKAVGTYAYLGTEIGKGHQSGLNEEACARWGFVGRPWGKIGSKRLAAIQRDVEVVKLTPAELIEAAAIIEGRRGAWHWAADPVIGAAVRAMLAGEAGAVRTWREAA